MNSDSDTALLKGFLSDHVSSERVVDICIEPETVYLEDGRDSLNLNFDFILRNLTEEKLVIRFIKAAIYDDNGRLVTFQHLNHNGVGTPGIHTLGKFELEGTETLDIFNPFHRFSEKTPLSYLRYMFTLINPESRKEYYYGNIMVKPKRYIQRVSLSLPIKGLITILDGHDFYSHHRRFAMSLVRKITENKFRSNFSRYALDFTVLGSDGNTRRMDTDEYAENYDFHFNDARKFYTDGCEVYAPADGRVVKCVDSLDDLYDSQFDMDNAIREDSIQEIAGNYVVIQHNEEEFSHLFHLMQDSVPVTAGDTVKKGQVIGNVGFSGAATTYSHLHYQLMNGSNFLIDEPLPCVFSDVVLIYGSQRKRFEKLAIDTGDIILSE